MRMYLKFAKSQKTINSIKNKKKYNDARVSKPKNQKVVTLK